ncbi:hypothetical protein N657DRAFT_631913 [Parathielavia appendiculata]|uniref:Uncharacterized protein n=1 Tax=Parathielavia appendiculata TaxID=2587402 RepID=A0AAN6U3U7_9PEZI|nr:hypothetical protein N657DRAFT_631913 [Parathielavia appendiculata]
MASYLPIDGTRSFPSPYLEGMESGKSLGLTCRSSKMHGVGFFLDSWRPQNQKPLLSANKDEELKGRVIAKILRLKDKGVVWYAQQVSDLQAAEGDTVRFLFFVDGSMQMWDSSRQSPYGVYSVAYEDHKDDRWSLELSHELHELDGRLTLIHIPDHKGDVVGRKIADAAAYNASGKAAAVAAALKEAEPSKAPFRPKDINKDCSKELTHHAGIWSVPYRRGADPVFEFMRPLTMEQRKNMKQPKRLMILQAENRFGLRKKKEMKRLKEEVGRWVWEVQERYSSGPRTRRLNKASSGLETYLES